MTDTARWERLATRYLKALAKADMKIWRARVLGQDACDEDAPMSLETAKMIGRLKRVTTVRREVDV
jgi:hypothetical protein